MLKNSKNLAKVWILEPIIVNEAAYVKNDCQVNVGLWVTYTAGVGVGGLYGTIVKVIDIH